MKLHQLIAPLLAWAALSSCAQTQPPPPTAVEPEAARLARELRTLIGPANCSTDAQCRTVAVGAKACGGPGGYWAWSSAGTDETQLLDLARRQAQAETIENVRSGMRSTCNVAIDPGARCAAGRCELRQPAGPASVR